MATNLLWFVLAGFLLGFATSTLWEWFYFRKERLKLTDRRILELEAKLQEAEVEKNQTSSVNPQSVPHAAAQFAPESAIAIPTVDSVTGRSRTSAWGDASYRSPGVFLESEEFDEEPDDVMPHGFEVSRPEPAANNYTSLKIAANTTQQTPPPTMPSSLATSGASGSQPVQPPVQPSVQQSSPTPKPLSTQPVGSSPAPTAPTSSPHVAQSVAQSVVQSGNTEQQTEARGEQLTPADALRAKRSGVARSRQEVLAELRRNSEAVRRGEQLPSADKPETPKSQPGRYDGSNFAFVPPNPYPAKDRSSSLETDNVEEEDFSAFVDEAEEQAVVAPQTPVAENTPAQPVLSPERERWINNAELTTRTQGHPDDLSKIKGIGDVYKYRLYRAGFYTWRQIAEADTEVLRRATSAYPSSNIDEWLAQAEKLMEKHGRKNATYDGPVPDDMTKILGIGPVSASVLYRTGICTYEQLAVTPLDELDALFPIAVAGDQPDFAQWVERAAALADEKHRTK